MHIAYWVLIKYCTFRCGLIMHIYMGCFRNSAVMLLLFEILVWIQWLAGEKLAKR